LDRIAVRARSTINGQSFCDYVEQRLVPTLSPDDIVVLENLGRRRRLFVRQAIRRTRSQAAVPAALIADLDPIKHALADAQTPSAQGHPALSRSDQATHRPPA
jgi:hypothetical protein